MTPRKSRSTRPARWDGRPAYHCQRCPFTTLVKAFLEEHEQSAHPAPAAPAGATHNTTTPTTQE